MEMLDFKDESSDPEALARKKRLFDEMYQRQAEERENQRKLKQIQDEQTKDPKELMLSIQGKFADFYNDLALRKNLAEFKPENPTLSIDALFEKIAELKDFYIASNHALTAYDKQQYKDQIDKLEVELYELKEKAQPRKKFAFSKKKPEVSERKSVKEAPETSKSLDLFSKIEGLENLKGQRINLPRESLKATWKVIGNTDCELEFPALFDCVFIKGNRGCRVSLGPVKSSVFIDGNEDCEISVMSHQIRIHNCRNVTFRLFSSSKSIIENCSALKIGRYKYKYEGFEEDFEKSGFSSMEDLWDQIQDFNWLKQEKSPNFELID